MLDRNYAFSSLVHSLIFYFSPSSFIALLVCQFSLLNYGINFFLNEYFTRNLTGFIQVYEDAYKY